MKLSIIVPVFNVEDYIRPCLESILKQGLEDNDYEIIIINDGTPDKSMEVIADLIETHHNIIIIDQENQGLSIARNNGIEKASGEYILFVDSDDLLIDNCVPFLLDKAISSKTDLIVADFLKMNDKEITHLGETFRQKDGDIMKKKGRELFLDDLYPYHCYVWRTMYRRDFINQNNLRFIPHIIFEDIAFTHHCYLKADLCLRVKWCFIIYRQGHTSITSTFSFKKAIDYCTAISEIWEMSKEESFDEQIKTKLQNNTFVHFSMLLYSLTSCTSISRMEKMTVLKYLKKNIPDLRFDNGIKQKIVNLLYHRMPSTYMTLRILYAKYVQNLFWKIGDTIRNKKNYLLC